MTKQRPPCDVEGCKTSRRPGGRMCARHAQRQLRHGSAAVTVSAAFVARVRREISAPGDAVSILERVRRMFEAL